METIVNTTTKMSPHVSNEEATIRRINSDLSKSELAFGMWIGLLYRGKKRTVEPSIGDSISSPSYL